jgi:hypothetical protein
MASQVDAAAAFCRGMEQMIGREIAALPGSPSEPYSGVQGLA